MPTNKASKPCAGQAQPTTLRSNNTGLILKIKTAPKIAKIPTKRPVRHTIRSKLPWAWTTKAAISSPWQPLARKAQWKIYQWLWPNKISAEIRLATQTVGMSLKAKNKCSPNSNLKFCSRWRDKFATQLVTCNTDSTSMTKETAVSGTASLPARL